VDSNHLVWNAVGLLFLRIWGWSFALRSWGRGLWFWIHSRHWITPIPHS
jgi:hypothetical protein